MPVYIMLSSLTAQGVQTLKSNPDRLREVNRDVEELGAKVLHQWATLGPFDFVNVVEAPDAATIARVSIALGARGSAKLQTLTALDIRSSWTQSVSLRARSQHLEEPFRRGAKRDIARIHGRDHPPHTPAWEIQEDEGANLELEVEGEAADGRDPRSASNGQLDGLPGGELKHAALVEPRLPSRGLDRRPRGRPLLAIDPGQAGQLTRLEPPPAQGRRPDQYDLVLDKGSSASPGARRARRSRRARPCARARARAHPRTSRAESRSRLRRGPRGIAPGAGAAGTCREFPTP